MTPNGPFKNGPGEVNVPISCGGIAVKPGDIVVGDADGIVVIDPLDAEDILGKARATVDKEAGIMAAIANNAWDVSWVERMLKEKGCEFAG